MAPCKNDHHVMILPTNISIKCNTKLTFNKFIISRMSHKIHTAPEITYMLAIYYTSNM